MRPCLGTDGSANSHFEDTHLGQVASVYHKESQKGEIMGSSE